MTTAGGADATDTAETADTVDGGDRSDDTDQECARPSDDRDHDQPDHDRDTDTGTEDARHVVTVFLRNAGEVLLLRRSDAVGTYRGKWGAVSGYAEGDPDAAARWEIDEETGLADAVTFVRRGDPVAFSDDDLGIRWVVHPFLFDCADRTAEPNEEATETVWVAPPEIRRRETVPELWTAYDRVRPRIETVATDTEHGSAWLSLRSLEVLRDEAALVATDAADGFVDRDARDGDERDARDDWTAVAATAEALLDARSSMTALANRLHRAMTEADARTAAAVERAAHDGIGRALDADRRASANAAERLAGETVLTLSRSGTVERALSSPTHPPAHVYVAESRPAREGVGVAERLVDRGIDTTLVTDAAIAYTLAGGIERAVDGAIDRVVVGADTVCADGTLVNKTGTRGAAIAAAAEGVPVDVVTAADKVSVTATVEGEEGPPTAVYDGDAEFRVANPTFDRTPAAYVTGYVTDRGVLDATDVASVAHEHRTLAAWRE